VIDCYDEIVPGNTNDRPRLREALAHANSVGGILVGRDLTRFHRGTPDQCAARLHELTEIARLATVYHPLMPEHGPNGWQRQVLLASEMLGRPRLKDGDVVKLFGIVDHIEINAGKTGKTLRWDPTLQELVEMGRLLGIEGISTATIRRLLDRASAFGPATWREIFADSEEIYHGRIFWYPGRCIKELLAQEGGVGVRGF
jgi:hypothetical protein